MPRTNAALFAAALALLIAVPTSLGAAQAGATPTGTSVDLGLALPAGSGEQDPLPLGTGVDGFYDVELRNLGPSASTGQLTVTMPSGLELGPNGVVSFANASAYDNDTGVKLTCSAVIGTFTCNVGSIGVTKVASDPAVIEIDVLASTGSTSGSTVGTPGTSVQLGVTIGATSATDTNPANDSVGSTIDFTGVADLSYSMTPAAPRIGVGRSTTVTLSVTNHGPQVAGETVGFASLEPNGHISIAGFDGATEPPAAASTFARRSARKAAMKSFARSGRSATVRAAAQAMTAGAATPYDVFWFIGDLASGATLTAHLVLTAKTAGTAGSVLFADSDAADPDCLSGGGPSCLSFDTVTATAQGTAAYIASGRTKSVVLINGLIKQYAPAGLVRSTNRTVILQRYTNGGWQNLLSRQTDVNGRMSVSFTQTHAYNYRLYVLASTTAAAAASGKTIR